jgi:phosphatidylserine/phosphatidylglycerophosphate/cardiolipin synthase-like enzyme
MRRSLLALVLAAALCALAAAASPAAAAIGYRTLFQDPGPSRTADLSLDNRAIALIDATPAHEQLRFTFRDFNSRAIADALIAAHLREVDVRGVIDGGERTQATVIDLVRVIGADRVVVCGAPGVYNSCISSADPPSLMHNKFLTFSRLADGRAPVVLQTSKNFLAPSQLTYYNDMVEIDGDVALYEAYTDYFADLQAQVRSDDHFIVAPKAGPNTIFTSPRFQATRDEEDTIVEQMDEIDCAEGGSSAGRGLIRVANMAFRSERAVIMRKLRELHKAGCEIDVIATNLDGDIVAGLASEGIRVRPFFLRGLSTAQRQVIVHSKFWLVDALSTRTGRRTKLVYAGSSNWRGDQQRSDDLLLRIADDGVYAAYSGYWEKIRDRAASDQTTPPSDAIPPATALTQRPAPNAAGWNRDDVTLRIAASDGHNVGNSGLRTLHVEMTGAQSGTWDLAGEQDAHRLAELEVTAEGVTAVRFIAEDRFGNRSVEQTHTVRIDRTPPRIAGLPVGCTLWPPNGRMVTVAQVTAADDGSGVASLTADASGGDVTVTGGTIAVRAEKAARGRARTYALTALATDVAGNVAEGAAECVVPHSQGG